MSGKRPRGRTVVVYRERRYTLCRARTALASHPNAVAMQRQRRRAGLLPGATLLLIVLFSVFVLERPPVAANGPQLRAPAGAYAARYTFADFASSYR